MRRFLLVDKVVIVLLLIIVGIGSFFRFFHYEERVNWLGDVGRDLLVSKHIWKYGEQLSFGHSASGLAGSDLSCDVRHYPNFYYYYLAFLWSITHHFYAVIGVSVLLHSLSLLCCYWIGYRVQGKLAGVLFALFVAVNNSLVAQASTIIGLQVAIPFGLLAICLVIESLHQKNRWLNILALFSLMFLSTFHYSILIFFGFFFVVSEVFFWRKTGKISLIASAARASGFGVVFILFHKEILQTCGIQSFLTAFINHNQPTLSSPFLALQIFSTHIIRTFPLWSALCFFVLMVGAAVVCWFAKKIPTVLLLTLLLLCGFIGLGAASGNSGFGMKIVQTLYSQYVLVFLVVICSTQVLQIAAQRSWWWLSIVGWVATALLLASSLNNVIFRGTEYVSRIDETKRLAEDFDQKFDEEQVVPTFADRHYGMYHTVLVAYWLEEVTGKQLYKLDNFAANYQPLNQSPQKRVLITDSRLCSSNTCEQERSIFMDTYPDYLPTGEISFFEFNTLEVFEKKTDQQETF